MAPSPVDVAVDAAATYRLTRLALLDSLPPLPAVREHVRRRWEGRAPAELVECPWCISVWLAAGVVVARTVAPRAWDPLARVLASSAVAGWLSVRE